MKIAVAAFRYPPYPGVGAYRWTRFTHRLAKLGHEMHVFTVNWPATTPQEWHREAIHPRIQIHRTPASYPVRFKYRTVRSRPFAIARNRLIMLYDRWRQADEASRWTNGLRAAMQAEHGRQPFDCLIATGPPFSVNAAAAQIAAELDGLPLVQDFRDPWFDSPAALQAASQAERTQFLAAIHAASLVVTVTEEMTELFQALDPGDRARRYATVHNGFAADIADAKIVPDSSQPTIVHIGSVFNDRSAPLYRLLDWVRDRTDRCRIVVKLVGNAPSEIARNYGDLIRQEQLILTATQPQNQALRLLGDCRFALQLNAPNCPTQVSTKIYEYAALRIPTLSINYGGAIDRLVREIDCGYSLRADSPDFEARMDACFFEKPRTFRFDASPFEFSSLAAQYHRLLSELVRDERPPRSTGTANA